MSAIQSIAAEHYHTRFLSISAKAKKPSPIRSLYPLESRPGLISLLAGKPNPTTFPFTSLSFAVRSPDADLLAPPQTLTLTDAELAEGLQYGPTAGLPALRAWVEGLQALEHGRSAGKAEGWRVSVGIGAQDLIYKTVDCLVDPGDPVLLECPTYAGVLPMFQSQNCKLIEVETDASGIRPDSLRDILESWPDGAPKPRVLYTIPYGCNPTGMTTTLDRRREVLSIAETHDLIILEDDPYYYVYYGPEPRPPSYFALELEMERVGRVLRFDSLSKILSAGMRLGFVSGPEALVNAIDANTQVANLQTPTLTQSIAHKLLEAWGYDGFRAHTLRVAELYRRKRDVFESKMVKYMVGEGGERMAEWTKPEAGMFFWFMPVLSATAGGGGGARGPTMDDGNSETLVRAHALEKGVLALPGTVFLPSGRKTGYVRAAFSLLEEDEVDEAVRRLRDAVIEARGEEGTA